MILDDLESKFAVPTYIAFYSDDNFFYFFKVKDIKNKITPYAGNYKIEYIENPNFNAHARTPELDTIPEHTYFVAHSVIGKNFGVNRSLDILDKMFNRQQ